MLAAFITHRSRRNDVVKIRENLSQSKKKIVLILDRDFQLNGTIDAVRIIIL